MHNTLDSSDPQAIDPQALDAVMQGHLASHCRQQLSAMIDGALPLDEARFLLRRLRHDQELAGCWERWQLSGDLLRGSASALLPRDFASRVTGAIAREADTPMALVASGSSSMQSPRPRWHGWAGGAALAASVAVVALLVQGQVEQDAPATTVPAAVIAASPLPGIGEPAPMIASSALEQPGAAALALAATASARRAKRGPGAVSAAHRTASPAQESAGPATPAASALALPIELATADLPVAAASEQEAKAYEADAQTRLAALGIAGGGPVQTLPTALAVSAPASAAERPWPRAMLPGGFSSTLNSSTLNADYAVPQSDGQDALDAFQPQPADGGSASP